MTAAPLLTTKYLPLVDYPNHLARCFILDHYAYVPGFQQAFIIDRAPIPNIGMDLVVAALSKWLGIYTAGRVFVLIMIMTFAVGVHLLSYSLRRGLNWLAPVAIFCFFNSDFFMGFLNYLFGLSLFFVTFGLWLRWSPKITPGRWMVLAFLTFATYFAHLTGYGFLLVGLSVFCVLQWRHNVRFVAATAAFSIPPLLAFFLFMTRSGSVGTMHWPPWSDKVISTLPFFISYDRHFDLLFLAGVMIALLAAAIHGIRIHSLGMTLGLIFFAMFLICPLELLTSSGADARFVPPALLLILFSVSFRLPTQKAIAIILIVTCLFVIRQTYVWSVWRTADRRIDQVVQLLRDLPEGAHVYFAFYAPIEDRPENKAQRMFSHIGTYAVIERNAIVSDLFTNRGQQPLLFRSEPFRRRISKKTSSEEWNAILATDRVVTAFLPAELEPLVSARLHKAGEVDEVAIWQPKGPEEKAGQPFPTSNP